MEKTEATFANGRLFYLNARLDLLRGVLESIRDQWMSSDIQELRDRLEERWSSAAVLPIWRPLYEARQSTNGKVAEMQQSISRALEAVETLRRSGAGQLPKDIVGDWSAFTDEYRAVRVTAEQR